jgi:class 3 adenylate cyclase
MPRVAAHGGRRVGDLQVKVVTICRAQPIIVPFKGRVRLSRPGLTWSRSRYPTSKPECTQAVATARVLIETFGKEASEETGLLPPPTGLRCWTCAFGCGRRTLRDASVPSLGADTELIGDSLMAIFGAPLPDPQHALNLKRWVGDSEDTGRYSGITMS